MTVTVWWIIIGVLFFSMAGIYIVVFFTSPFVVIGKWFCEKRARKRMKSEEACN